MSNTIRPKVSEAIKQIASSDSTGKSKSKLVQKKNSTLCKIIYQEITKN